MARVDDVAAYVLDECAPMTAMKLQKLVYYCQAWSLAWDERPLFRARIEAWANGPICPLLYKRHKGKLIVDSWKWGNWKNLNDDEAETVDGVLASYADFSAHQLSILTHRERPWHDARRGIRPGQRGSAIITYSAMYEYYEGLASE